MAYHHQNAMATFCDLYQSSLTSTLFVCNGTNSSVNSLQCVKTKCKKHDKSFTIWVLGMPCQPIYSQSHKLTMPAITDLYLVSKFGIRLTNHTRRRTLQLSKERKAKYAGGRVDVVDCVRTGAWGACLCLMGWYVQATHCARAQVWATPSSSEFWGIWGRTFSSDYLCYGLQEFQCRCHKTAQTQRACAHTVWILLWLNIQLLNILLYIGKLEI